MSKENSPKKRNNNTTNKKSNKKTNIKSKDTKRELKEDIKAKKDIREDIVEEEFDEDLEEFDEDLEELDEDLEELESDEDIVEEKETKSKKREKKKEKRKFSKKDIREDNIEEEDFDEDLEDFEDDEEKDEEIKTSKFNNKKEKENFSKERIKKIEQKAREKKNNSKKRNESLSKIGLFLDKNMNIIFSFILGATLTLIITVLIVILIWPTRIATLKNGKEPVVKVAKTTYTADDLYTQMKDHFSVNQLLDKIDNDLLTKMYPETEEMKKEVKENAEYYINMYKQYYNYTEEQFLSSNGFSSYDAFLEYLKLENRRKKYLEKYVKDNLTDKEIEEYYKKNVYGDINCQHILVETSSDSGSDSNSKKTKLSDEEGKKLAQEIIDKINDGKSWKDIQKEYKDKTTFEDLKYQSWDSDLEDSFKTALKEMDNKSYSKEPVKTSYGYHIIYRIDQKETPTLKKVKSKIVDKLVEQKQKDDSNLQYKALISLRKEKNIKFYDTDMQKKYEIYIKQYNK